MSGALCLIFVYFISYNINGSEHYSISILCLLGDQLDINLRNSLLPSIQSRLCLMFYVYAVKLSSLLSSLS